MRPSQRAIYKRIKDGKPVTPDLIIADIQCIAELHGYRDGMVRQGRMTKEIEKMIQKREDDMHGILRP